MEILVKVFDMAVAVLPGVALIVGGYVVYVGATKGAPAALSMVKGWWNRAKNDLATVKGDVAGLETKVNAEIAILKADVVAIKAKVGL